MSEQASTETLKQWAATRADDAGRLARELLALREQAGEPVAWRCQLLEGGDWFYFLTHPDLADNSPWETIVSLSREELQQELVALTKDRKSLRGMATLLAKAREPAAPPVQPGAVSVPTIEECFAAGKGPDQYKEFHEGGMQDTPEERARFEAYMRGHCWSFGNYDTAIQSYDTTMVRMLYGVWRDRGTLSAAPRQPEAQPRPKIVCLCGSTRFIQEMACVAWGLERDEGYITVGMHLLPDNYPGVQADHMAEHEGFKEHFDELHKRKIDLADEVLVFNIGGYIGESTRSEIDYAIAHGKPVKYMEDPKVETIP